ncbi:MAG: hypothetical protein M5U13_03690 [Thermoanaerobaculia bacterium]|nr:hypothetical protein [Thermoanaerobaculia bacterium]
MSDARLAGSVPVSHALAARTLLALVVSIASSSMAAPASAQLAGATLESIASLVFDDGFEVGSCEGWSESTCTCADGSEPTLWFEDLDEDLHGNPNVVRLACAAPPGYVSQGATATTPTRTCIRARRKPATASTTTATV